MTLSILSGRKSHQTRRPRSRTSPTTNSPGGIVSYRTTQVVERFGSRWEEALELPEELDGIPWGSKGIADPGREDIHPNSIHYPGEHFMRFWTTTLVDTMFTEDDVRDVKVVRE